MMTQEEYMDAKSVELAQERGPPEKRELKTEEFLIDERWRRRVAQLIEIRLRFPSSGRADDHRLDQPLQRSAPGTRRLATSHPSSGNCVTTDRSVTAMTAEAA